MTRIPSLLVSGIAMLAVLPVAQAQIYKVTLSGANEIPATATAGTGTAIISLNSTTHEMRVVVSFSGLVGSSTASHVHCCAVQPANVGVATTTPTFPGTPLGVTSGSWDRTYDMSQTAAWNAPFLTASGGTALGAEAAFITGVAAGRSYLNIHSTTFGGGEIRGFLVLNSFAGNAALGAGIKGAAAALDSLGAGTGALSNALVTLAALAPAPQAAAITMLAPAASRGPQAVVSESVSTAFDRVSDRLGGLRLAGDEPAGASPAQPANGFWLMGNGVDSGQDLEDGFAGYKNSGWGAAIGLDHRLAPGRFVGGSVHYSKSSLTYRDQSVGDTADVKSTQVSLYATQDFGTVFVDEIASYGWQKYNTTRNTGVAGIAAGAYDGETWGVRIGAGMPIAMSTRVSITPQVRIDWDSIKQDAFVETGGGPLALSIDTRSADRFRGSVGAQIDFSSDRGNLKMRPFLRGYWHQNLTNNGLDTYSTFVSGGTSFVTPAQKLERSDYALGAGLNFYTTRSFAAAITYDGTFADSYHSHLYEAKARWIF
jgi:outer membrane autotransporter protein